MSETAEKKLQPVVKISEKYYLTSDGSRNLILQEIYSKRIGKGKNAELSGETGLRDIAYHGSSISSLTNRLAEVLVLDSFNNVEDGENVIKALEDMKEFINEFKKELHTYFSEKVELKLGNIKGKDVDE